MFHGGTFTADWKNHAYLYLLKNNLTNSLTDSIHTVYKSRIKKRMTRINL